MMTSDEARRLAYEAERFYDDKTLEMDDPAGRLIAALRSLADEVDRLTKWEKNREEMYDAKKASCVDKCGHPAEFICDYEDGTRHCLECVAMKWWAHEEQLTKEPTP